MKPNSETVSVREAAERLGVSRNLLYAEIHKRLIPRVSGVGSRLLIPRRWLDDNLLNFKVKP
jgi:excisionase family DNA binding protein